MCTIISLYNHIQQRSIDVRIRLNTDTKFPDPSATIFPYPYENRCIHVRLFPCRSIIIFNRKVHIYISLCIDIRVPISYLHKHIRVYHYLSMHF